MNNKTNEYWEAIADDYDKRMGDDGNDFHRELIHVLLPCSCLTRNAEKEFLTYPAATACFQDFWHRPLQQLLGECFDAGYILDGIK